MVKSGKYLLLAAMVAPMAGGVSAQTLDPLVRISGGTPFARCTADQVASQPGTNFPSSAIEPWIAVNPTVTGGLLTGVQQDRWSNGGSRGLRAGVSGDGGHHWAATFPAGVSDCTGGRFQRSTDAWTAFGLDGTAYFFSLAFNNNPSPSVNGESAMLVSRSVDGGLTWAAPATLIDDTDPLAFNDKNSLTADPKIAGNAYAVWDRLHGPANAFRALGGSDDHGGAAAAANTTQDGSRMVHNRIATLRAAAAGTADAATAAAALTRTFGPTYFSRTTDSGLTWTPGVSIYDPGVFAQTIGNVIVGTPAGELIDFFDHLTPLGRLSIDFVRSQDHGLTWTKQPGRVTPISGAAAVTPDTQQAIRSEDIIFSVTADQVTGNLYVMWQDVPAAPGSQLSVLFAQSTDDGRTWSVPARVNKTPPNAAQPLRAQAFNGTVAVTASGVLVATYYDFRNDVFAGGHELTDAWVVFCKPGAAGDCTKPANWGREARLTPNSFDITQAPLTDSGYFLGDYFGLATQGTDAWPAFTAVTGPGQTSLFTRPIHLGAAVVAGQ